MGKKSQRVLKFWGSQKKTKKRNQSWDGRSASGWWYGSEVEAG